MSGPVRIALTDLAARFAILPTPVADALDTFGPDHMVWAWIDGDRLIRMQVIPEATLTAEGRVPQTTSPRSGEGAVLAESAR